jgi:hypothetical protein
MKQPRSSEEAGTNDDPAYESATRPSAHGTYAGSTPGQCTCLRRPSRSTLNGQTFVDENGRGGGEKPSCSLGFTVIVVRVSAFVAGVLNAVPLTDANMGP